MAKTISELDTIYFLKRHRVLMIISFLCFTLAGLAYLYLNETLLPHFVILNLKSPISDLPRGGWYNTEYTIQSWSDNLNRYYVWRRETTAKAPEFDSWNSVIVFFDKQMNNLGWERQSAGYSLCLHQLHEVSFLKSGEGESGYVAYVMKGKDSTTSPVACLAVWPYSYTGSMNGYDVVILTINPSLSTMRRRISE